jgi:hypothetical protein
VATPWGLKRPKFLPEVVAPASGVLQRMVTSIFEDYTEWCMCLHDNMLVLCTDDVQDGLAKLDKIIDRCIERRVVLKIAKSWIGFQEVKCFGYKVTPGKYELDEERKQGVLASPMPTSTKQMQRFFRVAVFFNKFIPNFAGETARLYDIIKTSFNRDKVTTKPDSFSSRIYHTPGMDSVAARGTIANYRQNDNTSAASVFYINAGHPERIYFSRLI